MVMEGKGEEEKNRERGREREREERDQSCLPEREIEKRENLVWKLKISFSQQMEGGSGHGLSLKETKQTITKTMLQSLLPLEHTKLSLM